MVEHWEMLGHKHLLGDPLLLSRIRRRHSRGHLCRGSRLRRLIYDLIGASRQ